MKKFAAILITLLTILFIVPSPAQARTVSNTPTVGWQAIGGTRPSVYAIARVDNMVILGGSFTGLTNGSTTVSRRNLAAIDANTGAVLSWNPSPNGTVRALVGNGSTTYVGGTFTSIGGSSRTNLAAINSSGTATGFKTGNLNAGVRVLKVHNGSLYAGGTFWKIGTSNRGGGASFNLTSGALNAWNPKTNYGIFALQPVGSDMYIGGPFTTVNGTSVPWLAKTNGSSGALSSWRSANRCNDPKPCHVLGLAADSSSLFVAAGGPGGRVYGVSLSSGSVRWQTNADGDFQAIAIDGNELYAGGHFVDTVSSSSRGGLVGLDKTTGKVLGSPSVKLIGVEGVWSILPDNGVLRVGGEFTTVGGKSIKRYTTFSFN